MSGAQQAPSVVAAGTVTIPYPLAPLILTSSSPQPRPRGETGELSAGPPASRCGTSSSPAQTRAAVPGKPPEGSPAGRALRSSGHPLSTRPLWERQHCSSAGSGARSRHPPRWCSLAAARPLPKRARPRPPGMKQHLPTHPPASLSSQNLPPRGRLQAWLLASPWR